MRSLAEIQKAGLAAFRARFGDPEVEPRGPVSEVDTQLSIPRSAPLPVQAATGVEEVQEQDQATKQGGSLKRREPLPIHKYESLERRVRRKAEKIALRRDAKQRYAAQRRADKPYCVICDIVLSSTADFAEHIKGAKHNKKESKVGDKGSFHCVYCDFNIDSKSQFERHLQSKKHRTTTTKKYALLPGSV